MTQKARLKFRFLRIEFSCLKFVSWKIHPKAPRPCLTFIALVNHLMAISISARSFL